jgi:far upstream element-binding protein
MIKLTNPAGGETIKNMQSTTGCKINVAQPSRPDIERQIGLVGSRYAIEQAKIAIMEKVDAVVSYLNLVPFYLF